MKKVLNLTLKKVWFDMILSGEKKHEYREYKEFWKKRFLITTTHPPVCKHYDEVIFRNGYSNTSPMMRIKLTGLSYNFGKEEWGGDSKNIQFVLSLGKILETKNISK